MKDKVHYNTIMRLDNLDLHRSSLVKVAAFLDALSLKYFLKTFFVSYENNFLEVKKLKKNCLGW